MRHLRPSHRLHAMNPPALDTLTQFLNAYVLPFAWRILGALALWIVGDWIIRILVRLARNAMAVRHVDKTLSHYGEAAIRVGLRIILCILLLGVFGIETTSLAALLAAAGIAIGTAWSGLLSNFAAGVFLVVLRPFKVGDVIQAAGVSGEVKSIGLFMTAVDTGENLRTYIGNSKVLADNIVITRPMVIGASICAPSSPTVSIQRMRSPGWRRGLRKFPTCAATRRR